MFTLLAVSDLFFCGGGGNGDFLLFVVCLFLIPFENSSPLKFHSSLGV